MNAIDHMKILVLGAGVVGTTSAWFLAKAGHEVTVVDRQAGARLTVHDGHFVPGFREKPGGSRADDPGAEYEYFHVMSRGFSA